MTTFSKLTRNCLMLKLLFYQWENWILELDASNLWFSTFKQTIVWANLFHNKKQKRIITWKIWDTHHKTCFNNSSQLYWRMTTAPIAPELETRKVKTSLYELPRPFLIYLKNEKDNDEGRFWHLLQDGDVKT